MYSSTAQYSWLRSLLSTRIQYGDCTVGSMLVGTFVVGTWSMQLAHFRRPSRAEHQWMEYTALGVGAVLATSWVAKHRGDFRRWYRVAREASTTFVTEHVWQPVSCPFWSQVTTCTSCPVTGPRSIHGICSISGALRRSLAEGFLLRDSSRGTPAGRCPWRESS